MNKVIAAASCAVGLLFGVGVSHINSDKQVPAPTIVQPNCPEEDSCGSPDYHDKGWYINGVRVSK